MADSKRLVTVDYLEEYTKGLIDQTYTPDSENAQSGKAVAEAINNNTATNLRNGSAEGSLRSINSKAEDSTYTIGTNATTEGKGSSAPGKTAHAEGYNTIASGNNSHAEGNASQATLNNAHAEGYTTLASGAYSHAEGGSTVASGGSSHAEGNTTTASGYGSHAEGINTKASGDYSHAEGTNTTASGNASHAECSFTTASGSNSHAEGNFTTASGSNSHAEGESTTASGSNSHAEGQDTIASSNYQHVQGRYNIEDSNNIYADIIGNGNRILNTPSNAATVDWQGNAWYAGDVYVGSTSGTNKDEGSKKLATEEALSTEQKRANSTFSNALKGSKSGSAILIDDISPVTHNMGVKISSNTVTNLKAVKVSRCGKNLLSAMSLFPTVTNNAVPIHFKAGQKYTISFTTTYTAWRLMFFGTDKNGTAFDASSANTSKYISETYTGTTGRLQLSGNRTGNIFTFTCNEDCIITAIVFWNAANETNKTYSDFQLELGTTKTYYEPYKECAEYTPTADGTVEGVTSLYPTTTLITDTEGVIIDCEYNKDINIVLKHININTWKDVQDTVRAGLGHIRFPVGYEFTTEDSITGAVITWVVRGHNHHAAANDKLKYTMTLEAKYVYSNASGTYIPLQFDAPEAFFYAADGLEAGTYNFTVANQVWYTADNGKTFQFTLTNPVPTGGQICLSMTYNATLEGKSVKTYASVASTEVIETATITEGSEGTSLGTTDGTGNINHMHRILWGSNNYAQSAARQWLNSLAAAGSVWTPTNKFDRPPSWVSSNNGFMHGLPTDFLEVVETAVIPCRTNSICECASLDGTEFTINKVYSLKDKFFLLSRPEIYGDWDSSSYKDGELMEYYEGFTNTERIKYDAAGSARNCWLRSPNPGYANFERFVNTSGALSNSIASTASGVAPACIIA